MSERIDWDKVTTQDMIATIRRDADELVTFEARAAFVLRTNGDWRDYAPIKPRTRIAGIDWHNYSEEAYGRGAGG